MVKIVIVCTSAPELNGHPTGLWLEELAGPYYVFQEKGYEVTIASPAGGPIPVDQNSLTGDFLTPTAKQFLLDPIAMGKLFHSVKLDTIDFDSVHGLFLSAGHGVVVDFVDNPTLKAAIESVHNTAAKPVAAVCHAPCALVQCNGADGKPIVAGKSITGFANSEEDAVGLSSKVPFMLETKLKELGGKYEKADDWNCKVVVDVNLITGQNPQSSEECAKELVKQIKE